MRGHRGVSYFVSTCGKTTKHPEKYVSSFEDEFGNTSCKELDRPSIAHFLHEFLPLIDEHNKQRQSLLNLERCWLTKDCWFRLLTTVVGVCVVNMHRWDRNQWCNQRHNLGSEDDDDCIQIVKFSDLICAWLDKLEPRKRSSPRQVRNRVTGAPPTTELERICGPDGSLTHEPSPPQIAKGRKTGPSRRGNCFVCRKCNPKHQATQWRCKDCHMPLCQQSRVDPDAGRTATCLTEHKESDNPVLGCSGSVRAAFKMPDSLKVFNTDT